MYQQNDLFADDHSIIGQLFDNLVDILPCLKAGDSY